MDPTVVLEELRELIRHLPFEVEEMGLVDLDRASDIYDKFMALDGWLRRGGYLPEPWGLNRYPSITEVSE